MRKIVTLFVMAASVMLHANAQETWNAVKVFEFGLDDSETAYNMYIDSVGTGNGEALFCFQNYPSNRLVKTDFSGNIIDETDNPYTYFTVFNGDTLVLNYKTVINVNRGDTIYIKTGFRCSYIAASNSGIYVYLANPYRDGKPSRIIDCLNEKIILETRYFGGLCCNETGVFIIERATGHLYYFDENNEMTQIRHNIEEPSAIAEFRGSLYVYSRIEKTLYRLEPPEGTAVYSITELKTNCEPIHYGLDGRMTESTTPGIHILRFPDGKINKIVVR